MKCMIISNSTENFLNFRKDFIRDLRKKGIKVIAVSPKSSEKAVKKIQSLGCMFAPVRFLRRHGKNPFKDLLYCCNLCRLILKYRPDIVITTTLKPNIYGCIAAHMMKAGKIYAMVEGAGSVFIGNSPFIRILRFYVTRLLRFSFKNCTKIFFLNSDDVNLYLKHRLVTEEKVCVIESIGVNLAFFKQMPPSGSETVLFIGRLLKEKGVYEYVKAAEIAKAQRPNLKFKILGPYDSNPYSITKGETDAWQKAGIIEYLGQTDDIRPYLKEAFVLVLPSYREGQGLVLVEAMACGRPVIATDVVGCRNTIKDGKNGYLVKLFDPDELADRIICLYDNPQKAVKMGIEGRKICEKKYNVTEINKKIFKEMRL